MMVADSSNRRKFVLVNHESPDFDSLVSTFLWLKAMGLSIKDPGLEFRFVAPGQRLTVTDNDEVVVVHFDTGKQYNADTNDFDHHGDDEQGQPLVRRFASSARTVFETFPNLHDDHAISQIINLTDQVDSAKPNAEGIDFRIVQEKFRSLIDEFNRQGKGTVILVTEESGPRDIVSLISNLEIETNEISDTDKLTVGVLMLNQWYNDKRSAKTESTTIAPEIVERFDRLAATFLASMDPTLFLIMDFDSLLRFYRELPHGTLPSLSADVQKTARSLWYHSTVTEIVELANLLREKQTTRHETEEAKQFCTNLNHQLAEANARRIQKIIPIILRRGPWEILKYLPTDEFHPRFQLILGLTLLRAWFNKKTARSRIQQFLDRAERTTQNSLTFARAPETTLTSKAIRYYLRRHYWTNKIDVLVTTYCDRRDNTKYHGITIVQNNVSGMNNLFSALRQIDHNADIYLYPDSNFVIYIKVKGDNEILTPERILQEAMTILRPSETAVPTEEDESTEA